MQDERVMSWVLGFAERRGRCDSSLVQQGVCLVSLLVCMVSLSAFDVIDKVLRRQMEVAATATKVKWIDMIQLVVQHAYKIYVSIYIYIHST